MTQRDFSMDAGRALAISLVTGYHLWRFFGYPAATLGPLNLYGPLEVGYTGVDLFFVISGFAMTLTWKHQRGSWGQRTRGFAFARILRLYPAYLFAILVWCALIQFGIAQKATGLYDIALHAAFLHTLDPSTFFSVSGVFWSLGVEAHFYFMFPFLVSAPRWVRLAAGASGVGYAVIMASILKGPSDPLFFPLTWNVITFLPLFVLGMEIPRLRSSRLAHRFAPFAGVLALAFMLHPKLVEAAPVFLRPSLAMLSREITGGCLAVCCLLWMPVTVKVNAVTRAITILGVCSYSIYLYNYVFLITPKPMLEGVAGAVAYFLFIIGTGILMWWLIERQAERARRHIQSGYLTEKPAPMAVHHPVITTVPVRSTQA